MEFSELAAAKFRKLDNATRERIVAKLEAVSADPERFLTRLSAIGASKLRVGDYRLLVDLDLKSQTMFVLTLGHRSVVYDRE